jgi:hypothetical protein
MSKILSITVYSYAINYRYRDYFFDKEERDKLSRKRFTEERTVPIADFEFKKLSKKYEHDLYELAEAVWKYGDFHTKLIESIDKKVKYQKLTHKLEYGEGV